MQYLSFVNVKLTTKLEGDPLEWKRQSRVRWL